MQSLVKQALESERKTLQPSKRVGSRTLRGTTEKAAKASSDETDVEEEEETQLLSTNLWELAAQKLQLTESIYVRNRETMCQLLLK